MALVEAFCFDSSAAVIMNVIGQILDPFMTLLIQVGNVVCRQRPCFMSPLRTERSFGNSQRFCTQVIHRLRNLNRNY